MIKTAKKIEKTYKSDKGRNIAASYTPERKEQYSQRLKDKWKNQSGLNPTCIYSGEGHPAWKGDEAKYEAIHIRLRGMNFLKTYCEHCGISQDYLKLNKRRGLALHCIDGDYTNYNKENWKSLCCNCHTSLHHKLRKEAKIRKMEVVNE